MNLRPLRRGTVESLGEGLVRIRPIDATCGFVLDEMARLVWEMSDGSRDIAELREAVALALRRSVEAEEIFLALDFLADANLLQARAAPPAAEVDLGRRALISCMAPLVGTTAAPLLLYSRSAMADEYGSKESSRKASDQEYSQKQESQRLSNQEYNQKQNSYQQNNLEFNQKQNRSQESSGKESDDKVEEKKGWQKLDATTEEGNKELSRKKNERTQGKGGTPQTAGPSGEPSNPPARGEVSRPIKVQTIHTAFPAVFQVVGHSLADFPEFAAVWRDIAHQVLRQQRLSPANFRDLHEMAALRFIHQIGTTPHAVARLRRAGFEISSGERVPVLNLVGPEARDATRLAVYWTGDPDFGGAWRYALDVDYQRIQFAQPPVAQDLLFELASGRR